MFDYCHEDLETGFMLARERFKVKVSRGTDIVSCNVTRESYSIFIMEGEKIHDLYQKHEEESMIDNILSDLDPGNIENTPCHPGQTKIVTGRLEFSECGDVVRFNNVKWEPVR